MIKRFSINTINFCRRYSIFVGCTAILDYLDFIENWYRDHADEIPAKEMEAFTNKIAGIRNEWPTKVFNDGSMKRQQLSMFDQWVIPSTPT